jgi:hypothetical protein
VLTCANGEFAEVRTGGLSLQASDRVGRAGISPIGLTVTRRR